MIYCSLPQRNQSLDLFTRQSNGNQSAVILMTFAYCYNVYRNILMNALLGCFNSIVVCKRPWDLMTNTLSGIIMQCNFKEAHINPWCMVRLRKPSLSNVDLMVIRYVNWSYKMASWQLFNEPLQKRIICISFTRISE